VNKLLAIPLATPQRKLPAKTPGEPEQALRVVRESLHANPPQLRFVARDLRLPQL
jgi:hypothetical protein